MCYTNPSIFAKVFPTVIEKLNPNAKNIEVDTIKLDKKHALAWVRGAQFQRQLQRDEMIDLQQLTEAPIDGVSNFESPDHEKGMKQGTLLENNEKDINSGWRPTSDVLMVKPTKHASRPNYKPNSKLKKRKTEKHPWVKEVHQ